MNLFQTIPMIGVNNGVWPRAIALLAGGGRFALSQAVRVLAIGDSLTAGRGAGSGVVQMDGARALSWPTKMRDAFIAAGFPASSESWAEAANSGGGTLPLYDPRVTLGGWTVGAGAGLGGFILNAAGAGAPNIFGPGIPVDTIELYLPTSPGFGTGTYQVDSGGSPVAFSETGTAALQKIVVSAALGTHDIRLNRVSGTVYTLPCVAYNSAEKDFRIINMGVRGASTTSWLVVDGQPWRPKPALAAYDPDIVPICLGTNDGRAGGAGTSRANYRTNLQTLVSDSIAAGAHPFLIVPPPWNTAVYDGGSINYAQIVEDVLTVAAANNIPVCRSDLIFGSWAQMVAAGYAYPDDLHMYPSGYAYWALFIMAIVREIARQYFRA